MKIILKSALVLLLLQAVGIQAQTATNIAAALYHSLFLKSDGSLWAMGQNNVGQLGDGTSNNTNRPEQIVPSGVIAVAAGGSHSLFLKSNGSLWAMGDDSLGQLGDGFTNSTSLPEQIFPSPQPTLTSITTSGTSIQFTASVPLGGNILFAGRHGSYDSAQPVDARLDQLH